MKPMAFLRSLFFTDPLIIASTVAHWFIGAVAALFVRSPAQILNRCERSWGRSLLRIAGVRLTVEGLDRITPGGQYVFVSNHLSYMDTPTVLGHIPVHFRFLAKAELFRIPVLGWHLRRGGHISVPLEDPRGSLKTLSHAAAIVQKDRISILIFPEGGRSENGVLQDFKDGAAFLAIKAQVPVVPLALIGIRSVLPMGSWTFHPGAVVLRIGDPIPTKGMANADRKALTAKLRGKILEMLDASPSSPVSAAT